MIANKSADGDAAHHDQLLEIHPPVICPQIRQFALGRADGVDVPERTGNAEMLDIAHIPFRIEHLKPGVLPRGHAAGDVVQTFVAVLPH